MSHPWMPLYVSDYLGDTSHLNTLEHGAYILLLMSYWQQGGLPTDDAELAVIARMQPKDWMRIRAKLAKLFRLGEWKHKRVEEELARTDERYQRRAAAGRQGGNARARSLANGKQTGSNASSNAGSKRGSKPVAPGYQLTTHTFSEGSPNQAGGHTIGESGGDPLPRQAGRGPDGSLNPGWDDDAPFGSEVAA